MSSATETKASFAFVSLGCPKNLVDSERMLGLLGTDGYAIQPNPQGADFVIVNTCGFIDPARKESMAVIREMVDLKKQGEIKGIIVSGCLAERNKEALLEEVPEIDHLVGVFGREEITKVARRFVEDLHEQRNVFRPAPVVAFDDRSRLRITPRHFAYLKISEGCDRLCTFCAIPQMRGKHVSKPIEQIVSEATELAADGVRELNIVAQDTTYYGRDIYGQNRLAELLRQLDRVDGLEWIRLMYCYPQGFDDELFDTLSSCEKLLPYIDLPLQHINDRMLRRMQRRVDRSNTERLLDRLRDALPGLVLRTTFITGFPGETDQEFAELEQFVWDQEFARMGVFEYSYEPSTPSARLPDHVPDEIKSQRREQLMAVQAEISYRWNEDKLGAEMVVLIDAPAEGSDDQWIGRSYADAPDVDCQVRVHASGLRPGRFVPVEITGIEQYDLVGHGSGSAH